MVDALEQDRQQRLGRPYGLHAHQGQQQPQQGQHQQQPQLLQHQQQPPHLHRQQPQLQHQHQELQQRQPQEQQQHKSHEEHQQSQQRPSLQPELQHPPHQDGCCRAAPSPLRVAVVGSGLAGLTTAYLLCREGCEVWLVEKADTLGFHAASVDVPLNVPSGKGSAGAGSSGAPGVWTIDAPMRSFQGGYYPGLFALYKHLGLPIRKVYYTFSFSRGNSPGSTYFLYSGASGLSIPNLPSQAYISLSAFIFTVLDFLGMAVCQVLFILLSFLSWHRLLPFNTLSDLVFAFSTVPILGSLWARFTHDLIVPVFGAVGTMTTADVLNSPLPQLLDYVHSTVGTPHYTLGPGFSARDVASLLVQPVLEQGRDHLRLGEEIVHLRWQGGAGEEGEGEIELGFRGVGEEEQQGQIELGFRGGGETVVVDRVVLATQASAARRLASNLLETLAGSEKNRVEQMIAALGDVEYRDTIVVTHRDASVLPSTSDRQAINLVLPPTPPAPHLRSPATPFTSPSPLPPTTLSDDRQCPIKSTWTTTTPTRNGTHAHAQDGEGERESDTDSNTTLATPPDGTPLPLKQCPHFPPSAEKVYTMGTHIVNPPRSASDWGSPVDPVFQTTNPVVEIRDGILAVSQFERALPLRDPKTTLQILHPRPSSNNRILYLAGSYAHPGIPLLEGCIGSARRVVQDMLSLDPDEARVQVGKVDWRVGRGGLVGRTWRWRRAGLDIEV